MLPFLQKARVGDESFFYNQENLILSKQITSMDKKLCDVEKRVFDNENEINTLKSKRFYCVIS